MFTSEDLNDMKLEDFKCDACKQDVSLYDLKFLGSKEDFNKMYVNTDTKDVIGIDECSPFMEMVSICKTCFNKKHGHK